MEWGTANDAERTQDVLKIKFLCVSCYNRKGKEHWYLPKAFGCTTAADVHTTVYRDGMWRRCLRCRDALPTRTCDVCKMAKELALFNVKRLEHHATRGELLRCNACMTCSQCRSTKIHSKQFSTIDPRLCLDCVPKRCAKCFQQKPKDQFNATALRRDMHSNADA